MLKFYGSHLCKDCVNLKANCEKYGIAYEYSDISNDLAALKGFLKLIDENPVFNRTVALRDSFKITK